MPRRWRNLTTFFLLSWLVVLKVYFTLLPFSLFQFLFFNVNKKKAENKYSVVLCCAADITEVTGKEQTAQPPKRGRGRKQ